MVLLTAGTPLPTTGGWLGVAYYSKPCTAGPASVADGLDSWPEGPLGLSHGCECPLAARGSAAAVVRRQRRRDASDGREGLVQAGSQRQQVIPALRHERHIVAGSHVHEPPDDGPVTSFAHPHRGERIAFV